MFVVETLTYKDLVEEVLNELLLQWAGGEETVKVCTEKLGDKIAVHGLSED